MRLSNSEKKLLLAVQLAELGIGEVDYIKDTITLDERAASLFEVTPNVAMPRPEFHARLHPEDRILVEYEVKAMLAPGGDDYIMLLHRVINGDGSIRWLRARKQVYYDGVQENGEPNPVSGFVIIEDVTSFKEAESRIQYLMGEVSHRAKNMLSVVQGIARMTARSSDPADFMSRFSERLTALGSNQLVLVDDKWTQIDIHRLAKMQLEPYSPSGDNRISYSGPHIILKEKSAQTIGMAFHELATNAVKYGAFCTDVGNIDISWDIKDGADGQTFQVEWEESGGPPVIAPTRKGFGESVVRNMAASSVAGKVTLDYDPEGVRWTLTAPLKNVSDYSSL